MVSICLTLLNFGTSKFILTVAIMNWAIPAVHCASRAEANRKKKKNDSA